MFRKSIGVAAFVFAGFFILIRSEISQASCEEVFITPAQLGEIYKPAEIYSALEVLVRRMDPESGLLQRLRGRIIGVKETRGEPTRYAVELYSGRLILTTRAYIDLLD